MKVARIWEYSLPLFLTIYPNVSVYPESLHPWIARI